MSKKTILLAAAQLSARFPEEKGGEPVRQTIEPGTHLTQALLKKFGISDVQLEKLKERGHVVESAAHVVTGSDDGDAAIAAAEKRATDAEAAHAQAKAHLDIATGLLNDEQKKSFDAAVAKVKA